MADKNKSRWRIYGAIVIICLLILLGLTYCLQQGADDPAALNAPQGQAGATDVNGQKLEIANANLTLTAVTGEGGETLTDGVSWEIHRLTDQNTRQFVSGYPYARGRFALAPGRYVARSVRGTAYGEALIEVRENEPLEKTIIVGSGEVRASAVIRAGGETIKDALSWEVYEITPEGVQRYVTGHPYAQSTFALSPGPHILRAKMGFAVADTQVNVEAGKSADAIVVMNSGSVRVSVVGMDGVPMVRGATWEVYRRGDNGERSYIGGHPYPSATFYLNEGAYELDAVGTSGKRASHVVDIVPGDALVVASKLDQ